MRMAAMIGGGVLMVGFTAWLLWSLLAAFSGAAGALASGRILLGLLVLAVLAGAVWWFVRDLRDDA